MNADEKAELARQDWMFQVEQEELAEELREAIRALPEPTLGKKGGVNRQAVIDIINRLVAPESDE